MTLTHETREFTDPVLAAFRERASVWLDGLSADERKRLAAILTEAQCKRQK